MTTLWSGPDIVAATASAYLLPAMKINPLPAGFVVPAQSVKALKPPIGADWVHEIEHGMNIAYNHDALLLGHFRPLRPLSPGGLLFTARNAVAAAGAMIG